MAFNLDDLIYTPSRSTGPQDRIKALIEAADEQIALAEKLKKKDPTAKIVAQRDWFKELDNGSFDLKIGRAAYPYKGKKNIRFNPKDHDQLIEAIKHIKSLAQNDAAFQKEVREYVSEKKKK